MNKPELNPGEHYAGIILGKDEEADYHLILLPETDEGIDWADAKDWAAEQGGELPTRREQSLLFANLKEQFQPLWHWSCETHAGDARSAWGQGFGDGYQYEDRKGFEFCARAVRREEVK